MSDIKNRPQSRVNPGKTSLVIAILAIAAVLIMVFGAQLGVWDPLTGFMLYRSYANPIGYAVTVLAILALVFHLVRKERSGQVMSGIALLLGAMLLSPLIWATIDPPVRAPPIHDITTDTQNPPQFLMLDDTRSGAKNSLTYDGEETAAIQREAYPDIAPILTNLSAEDAYQRALSIADDMKWQIVTANQETLRFEATTYTPAFHFADDIVLVVTPVADGSRVDLRSVSRVGRGDQGVNAARIRTFSNAFQSEN